MKQNKSNQAKVKIQEATCEQLLVSAQSELDEWIKQLKKEIKALDEKAVSYPLAFDKRGLAQAYLGFLEQYLNHDLFSIDSPYSAGLEAASRAQKTLKTVFLESELLTKMSKQLNLVVTISENITSELPRLQNQVLQRIIQLLMVYSKGYLSTNSKIPISLIEIGRSSKGDLKYYYNKIYDKKYAIYSIGHQRLPSFSLKSKQVVSFKAILTLQLEAILKVQEDWKKEQILKEAIEKLEVQKEHEVKYRYRTKQLTVDEGRKAKNKVQYFSWKNPNLSNELIRKYHAEPIVPMKCSQFQSEEYLFQYKEQLFHQWNNRKLNKHSSEEIDKVQEINYTRAQEYVEFLSGIPNFKFKLTRQQKNVIGKDGNLIVIGRSGTGKTLVSILRLYAIQFLNKSSEVYSLMRQGDYNLNCIHHYINKTFKEKNTFLTASSFLIEEIMKQYRDMHYHLQKEHKESCQECKQHLQIGLQAQSYNMDLDAILERIERRENIRSSVSQLNVQNFPEFFTVKSLLNIFDSGLQRPFFDHQKTQEINEKEKSVVNIYWEGTYWVYEVYEENLKMLFRNRLNNYSKFELKNREQKDKSLVALEVDYRIFANNIWKDLSDNYFRVVKKKKSSLNASVVWAQIYSIIKGSAKAHVTHLKCLSPEQYLDQSKSTFLTLEDKIDIYHIFQEYQKYKNYNKAYDLMDIVNHILQQIMLGRYSDQKLDNVFIDEVQDLTPATIYLLTIMTRKNIFYCGDTAQAISKGVTFKFSEIKSLFSKKYFQDAVEKEISNQAEHLTVNFRTHNRILKLANIIVSMIKELFPKSIDVLEEERSDLFGPKPILICDGDQRTIYELFLSPPSSQLLPLEKERINKVIHDELVAKGRITKKKKESIVEAESTVEKEKQEYIEKARELMSRHLSSEQVILVRSSKQKEELPCFLKKQLKLTCEEVKGLEYEDVVIYKFFQSSPCSDKWILLDNLDIAPKWIDQKTFQTKISRRAVEEGRQGEDVIPDPLDLVTKIQLGYDRDKKMYKVLELSRNGNYEKIDIKDFHEISSELKLFYTLLTRAKNTVIIFDSKVPRQLMRFLQELDAIKIITPSQLHEEKQLIKSYKQKETNLRYLNKENLWNEEGIRQLVRKNYDEAINCFEKAQNARGVKRAQAEKIMQSTNYELYQIDNQLHNPTKLTRQEFKMKKIRLIRRQDQLNAELSQAAVLLEEIEMYSKAGQIYTKAKHFTGAIRCFEKIGRIAEIADSYFELKDYKKAASYYQKTKNINRIAECYLKLQRWKQALQLIRDNQNLIKVEFDNNPSMKSNIKRSLSEILNSIMNDDEKLRSEQEFNKGFYNKKHALQQNKQRQRILDDNYKVKQTRLQHIICEYNLLNLNQILPKIQEKKDYLNTYQKQMKELQQQGRKREQIIEQLEKHRSLIETELKAIFTRIESQARSVEEIERLRNIKGTLYHQETVFKKEKEDLKHSISQNQKKLEQIVSRQQKVQYQYINKFIKTYCPSEQLKLLIDHLNLSIQREQKKRISLPSIMPQLTNVAIPLTSEPSPNALYRIWLSKDTINSILEQAKSSSNVAFKFIKRNEKKTLPFFDHRGTKQNIEGQLCSKNGQMQEVFRVYEALQRLNCVSIRYIVCQKYLLRFHLHELVLEDILRSSKNFFQKRRVKEIERFVVADEILNQICRKNQEKIDKITMLASKASFTEYATKERTYDEPCLQNLRLGLVLQGFYHNSLAFCSETQKFKLLHLYMDYESLLSEAVLKAKNINMKLKEDMKYLFFSLDSNSDPVYHLMNVFSIQKIYFDFDQCESSPILGKAYSTEDIELTDSDIEECQKTADQRIKQHKQRVQDIDEEVKQKQQQGKEVTRQYEQQIREAKIKREINIKRIQKLKEIIKQFQNQIRQVSALLKKDHSENQKISKDLQIQTFKKKIHERRLEQLRRQLDQFKLNASTNLQEGKFMKQLEQRVSSMKIFEEKTNKVIEKEGIIYRLFEQRQKSLKHHKNRMEKLATDKKQVQREISYKQREIEQFRREQQIIYKKKQNAKQYQEDQIKMLRQFKKRWGSKELDQENEQEVNRFVINSKKRQIIKAMNEQKKQEIIKNIKKSSNLQSIKQFQLVNRLIKKQLEIDDIVKDKQAAEKLIRVFSLAKDIDRKTLEPHQLCMIAISYLNFLFNQHFRKLCLDFCYKIKRMTLQKWYENESYKREKTLLERKIAYNQQKLNVTISKLQKPQNYKNTDQLQKQRRSFAAQLQKLTNQYHVLNQRAQTENLELLGVEPITHILNLLNLYQKLKNATDKNYAFLQIFLGFFQCRIIKDCETLSFLEGQYTFVTSDSIILSRLQASEKSMCYYFDYKNKVVLAPFSSVYKVVLDYIQKQQMKVYEDVPELMKFKEENNQMIKLSKKNNYMQKPLLGYQTKETDSFMHSGQRMAAEERERKQIDTLQKDYRDNGLLSRVKRLRRQVLEFYLSKELKEKETFFFVLYQLRQYCSVEKVLNLMTFFNPKIVKQLKVKVAGLEEAKTNWIQKERNQYQPLPCLIG